MARYFLMSCENPECPSKKDTVLGDKTSHRLIGVEGGEWIGMCESCEQENRRPEAERTVNVKKRSWPYYNDSVGVTFESESHEKQYVKEHKLIRTN